ncbi:hypothetical protein V3C10_04285 [[Clostridium] symbiosum]|uniref:hypothetical protein n=1 Tax=Clostridium symbiosum TaxID=1512 RepID=UPI001D06EF81|nr:hypothetical protein [[Clostridium] symbiosum]MCB6610198.1 hypothetical protein [[Clostridium] symbiosum]MCB6933534.1 hypothetical protein [[Clostridium] symbiosum]
MRKKFPMNLQLFAHPGTAGAEPPAGELGQQTPPAAGQQAQTGQSPAIDYSKIQQMLEGTLAAKEDTALKAYFKQQGLSQEEAEQAMTAFKQQKAAQQPDVGALQTQLAQAQAAAQKAMIDNAATMTAISLGLDAKTIPYILKMADLSQVMGQDGKINEETLKTALNKVLEDVPALKPQPGQATGFVQVGASGGTGQQQTTDDALKKAFGL